MRLCGIKGKDVMWHQKIVHKLSWWCAKVEKKCNYYYQGVTTIPGTKKFAFIVYKNKLLHIKTIKFEVERWHNKILPPWKNKVLTQFLAFGLALKAYSKIIGQHPILNKKAAFLKKKGN